MPYLGSSGTYSVGARTTAGAPSLTELQIGSRQVMQQNRGLIPTVAGDIGFGVVDLLDTASSSVGLSQLFGGKRGSINQAALNAIDSPGLTDFYNDNQGGIEAASGIAGIVAAELITRRITAPTSVFMAAASKLPYVRRLATLDAEYATAMQTVRNVDRALAERGTLGVEQYVGRAVVDAGMFDSVTGAIVASSREVSRNGAVAAARFLGFGKGVRNAAVTEGVMAITLNQNGFLYDDEASHNIAWSAAGLVLGGSVEWLHSAYAIRKFVNGDEIRRTFAGALDPERVEETRLLWHGKPLTTDAGNAFNGANGPGTFLGGSISDRITSIQVNASLLRETPTGVTTDARALLGNREVLATQHAKLAREEVQKIVTKGISTNGYTRFTMGSADAKGTIAGGSRGYSNHVDMLMHRDAGALYGVEMLGGIGDDMTIHGVHTAHVARVEERIKEVESALDELAELPVPDPVRAEQLQTLRKRLEFEHNLTPMASIDGELMPISEATAIEGFIEPKEIRFTAKGKDATQKDRHGMWEVITENPAGGVSVDSEFAIHLPNKKNLDNADHFEMLRLYRASQKAVDQMIKFEGPLILPKKPNWFQLDMAEEVLRRSEGRAHVVFPDGLTREQAQVESLIQKAKGMAKWDKRADAEDQVAKLRVRYNLPRLSAYERGVTGEVDHPVMNLLRGIAAYGPDEVKNMGLAAAQEAAAKFKRIGDVAPTTAKDMDLFGSSFRYMLDESGNPLKPLILYKRPQQSAEWTKEYLAERLAAAKLNTVTKMTDRQAGPITRAISESTLSSPDFDLAARTHELLDTQVQGSLTGAAPQNPFGAAGKAVVTSEWRDRDSPILLAATRIREAISRQTRDFMKLTMEGAFGDTLGVLANPRNSASSLLLDQFHSFASGWDIATDFAKTAEGFHMAVLSDTAANRERFKALFGREMAKGQSLLTPSGKSVVLDDLAVKAQTQFNAVTAILAEEKNTLLRAQGRGQIAPKMWYVPPPNTNGKFIGFTFGPDKKTIGNMTVVESTAADFAKSRRLMEDRISQMGMGYTFRTQDEVHNFASIWDRAQMDFVDPGTTAIQPNKQGRGALSGAEVKYGAFNDSLKNIRDQFLRHSDDITEVLFKDQINAAKARSAISSEVTRNKAGFYRDQKLRSVYDMYLENLLGTSKLQAQGSFVGRVYNSIEGTIDSFLGAATPPVSKVWHATNEWINKSNPWSKSAGAKKDFDALSTHLGQYMPFDSATKMLERQGAGATPLTVAKITGGVNRFSAAILLRMFEVAHPIMNLSGIVNAVPSVIRHMTPRVGETGEEFAARIGHSASIFNLGDKGNVGVVDMGKLGSRAFKRAWSRAAHADYAYMVRNGFLHQEVAEFHRQFGAIESKQAWQAFFVGDATRTGFNKKGVVGWTSVLSDRSEDFSRSWAHMVGLELADELGIATREAKHSFAHDIANKMIANYSPQNRPEIFQGAMGAPIGLFQSFMQNYYQRLFRYTETKDFAALGQQYAMQAGLFGATGLPGWDAFNTFFMNNSEGKDDPTSSIWRRFGGAADLIGGGAISNIPALFGLPAVDLYSRGDTTIRQFGVDFSQSPGDIAKNLVPAVGALSKIWEGMTQGLAAFSSKNPNLTVTQLGEIASNMIANRPVAGIIEQFMAGGKDTDRYGQLVSDTENAAEATYRLLGLRSMAQSRQVQAYYANKTQQEHKAAADDILRTSTRAAIREGSMEKLPEIFNQYLKNGGDPRYFRRWIKENYEAATKTRSERQLESALKNPARMDEVLRLLDAGVSIDSDENTKDPQLGYGPQDGDELNQTGLSLGNYAGQQTIEPPE